MVGHRDVGSGRCRGAGPAASARAAVRQVRLGGQAARAVDLGAYVSAKHAVVGPVLETAADLHGTGVTATAVSAGSTRTPMLLASAVLYDLEGPEDLSAQQLVAWLLEPGEVAAARCWLCCQQSCAMTGSVLPTDPGRTA